LVENTEGFPYAAAERDRAVSVRVSGCLCLVRSHLRPSLDTLPLIDYRLQQSALGRHLSAARE
jgi:hypothetical protein